MTTPLGDNVSRILSAANRNYSNITFQANKPVLDSEVAFIGKIQDERSAELLRSQYPSGVLDYRAANQDQIVAPTLDPGFPNLEPNEFLVQNFTALVNGYVLPVGGSSVNGGQFSDLNWNAIELPSSPTSQSQQNFLFLEMWFALIEGASSTNKPANDKVYRFGNIQYRGSNLDDEVIDPQFNIETSRRVQVQYKIRIVNSVDLSVYPNGLEDPSIRAQGPLTSDSGFSYVWQGDTDLKDPGLWIAGDGTSNAASSLGTTDGYVYAIPLMSVNRRNSSAYSVSTNPNGSAVSILNIPDISDRPDGLYYDEVAARDVVDLRRLAVVNEDFNSILESNFEKLANGELSTVFGRDISNIQFGTRLLEADGLTGPTVSVPSKPAGVYFFGLTDNSRRSFNDAGQNEVHFSCLDLANAAANNDFTNDNFCASTGSQASAITVSYQGNVSPGAKITIDINTLTVPIGTVVANVIPTMTWASNGAPVAKVTNISQPNNDGWIGLGTSQASVFLDETDSNFQTLSSSGQIEINYTIQIGKGGGFRYIPDEMYWINNNATGETLSFAEVSTTERIVPKFERSGLPNLPIVNGFQDELKDFNYQEFSTPRAGYTRLYTGHFAGNGTANYNTNADLPSGLVNADGNTILLYGSTGQRILGFTKFERLNSTSGNFEVIPVQSITRGAANNFVIQFNQAFSSSDTIRYHAVLDTTHCLYTKASKGVVDFAQVSELNGTVLTSGSATFTAPNSEIIYNALAFDPDGTGSNVNYALLVDGTFSGPVSQSGFGSQFTVASITGFNTNTVTVNMNTGDLTGRSVQLVVTHSYSPLTNDLILFYYDHESYQGTNQSINNSVIKSVGQHLLMHTLGTGVTDSNVSPKYLSGVSTRLPLGAEVDDSDLDSGTEISVVGQVPTVLFKTNIKVNDYTRGTGTIPSAGQKIVVQDYRNLISSTTPLPSVPRRGISPYILTLEDKLHSTPEDNYLELATLPITNSLVSYQGAWYALVEEPKTGELLMLVVTGVNKNTGLTGQGNLPADTQYQRFMAGTNQTTFNLSFEFPLGGQLLVFVNGVKSFFNLTYVEADTNTVEFIDPGGLNPTAGDIVEFVLPKGQVNVDRNTISLLSSNYAQENDRNEQYLAYDVYRCQGRPTLKPVKDYGQKDGGGVDYTIPSGGLAQTPSFSPDVTTI